MSNWIRTAEAALSGRAESGSSVDVIARGSPPIIDAAGARALLAPFLAAFFWAAVVFRERQAHTPLEPLALLFRVLALALTLRALRVLIELAGRVRMRLAAARYALVLTDEGLLFRSPTGDVVVPRAEVLDVREQAAGAPGAPSGLRWAAVYVVTHPDSPRLHVALPPLFGRSPRALAELLMRWSSGVVRGSAPAPASFEPDALPSKLWERVAAGERLPGVATVRHGNGWLKRGPYASMLLGLAVLDGSLRVPVSAEQPLNMLPALLLAAALVVAPAAWILYTRISLAARGGIALLLTPAELLTRTRGGITRVDWPSVTRCEVQSRSTWSLLQGAHQSRSLVVHRKEHASLVCTEAFLSLPAEVVAALCDAYRRGLIAGAPVAEPPALP
jgi:hypothetical protein